MLRESISNLFSPIAKLFSLRLRLKEVRTLTTIRLKVEKQFFWGEWKGGGWGD
jgi:hypothetical protein